MAANRFAKYIVQPDQDQGGGTAPAPAKKPNRFAKYVTPESSAQPSNGAGMGPVNPMVEMGQRAQAQLPAGYVRPEAINQTNPIVAAQRASQTQAGTAWAAQEEARKAEEARRLQERREASAAYGAGSDFVLTHDAQGQLQPGTDVDRDISKGIIRNVTGMEPINAASRGIEGVLNLPGDALQSAMGGQRVIPKADLPEIPVPQELQSLTGDISGLVWQYALARGLIGKAAPGGGLAGHSAKDAATIFSAFDSDTPRLSETAAADFMRENGLGWMAERDPNNPLMERVKNSFEELFLSYAPAKALEMTPKVVDAVTGAGRVATVPTNAAGARPGPINTAAVSSPPAATVPPVQPQAAAQAAPSFTPPPVAQSPGRGAQAGATGAGQQAPGGAQPVLNAVPAGPAPVSKQQRLIDRDTIKITRRIMRSAGIKDADVMGYLSGAVQRFKSLNDARVPLAFFLKSDLPKHFPDDVANQVGTNLDVWGRARNAETGSRGTINKTTGELRKTQQDFLTQSAERNLFKGSLIGREDQIISSLRETGKKGYEPVLDYARQAADGRRAPTPAEAEALSELSEVMSDPMMLGYVDDATRIRAKKEGVDIDQLIDQDPVGGAHWLQSEFRRLSDAAEDAVTGKPTRMSQAYDDLRDMILDPLKRAAPGYEGAMNRYGHQYGAKEAVRFGKGAFTTARSTYETAQMVRRFKKLGRRQQTVAWMSIRDEFLNEFRGTPEEAAAKITRMSQEGALDLLEQLGPRGKKFADDIRKIAQVENPNLRAIDQGSGSPTHSNARGAANAIDMVQSPINRGVGALGDKTSWPVSLAGDAVLAASGLPPVLTASKVATGLVDRFGNPSKKVLNRATEGLYGLPKVAPPTTGNKLKRLSPPRKTAAAVDEGDDMEALLRALDETEANPAQRGGAKGKALLNKIDAASKAPKPPTTRKKTPPKPNDAGFAGMTPLGILAGGSVGAMADKENPVRGALIGAGVGGMTFGGAAKLAKGKPGPAGNALKSGGKPSPVGKADDPFGDKAFLEKKRLGGQTMTQVRNKQVTEDAIIGAQNAEEKRASLYALESRGYNAGSYTTPGPSGETPAEIAGNVLRHNDKVEDAIAVLKKSASYPGVPDRFRRPYRDAMRILQGGPAPSPNALKSGPAKAAPAMAEAPKAPSSKVKPFTPDERRAWQAEKGPVDDTPYFFGTQTADKLGDIENYDLSKAGSQSGSGERAIFLTNSPKRANSYSDPGMITVNGYFTKAEDPAGWEKVRKFLGGASVSDAAVRGFISRSVDAPGVFKAYVRGPVRDVDWVEYTGSVTFDDEAMKRLIDEEMKRRGGPRNIRIRNIADGGNDRNAVNMVVLDPDNVMNAVSSPKAPPAPPPVKPPVSAQKLSSDEWHVEPLSKTDEYTAPAIARPLYHKTAAKFDSFNGPTFFSTDPNVNLARHNTVDAQSGRIKDGVTTIQAVARKGLKRIPAPEYRKLINAGELGSQFPREITPEQASRLSKMGYDYAVAGTEVVIFDPKNVRRIDAPPSPTVKPSGAPKNPPMKNGFGGSKLPMDEASRMQRAKEWADGYEEFAPELYIGTTHDVDAFNIGKYNIENDWGRAVYATNSKTDVAHNYAGEGPDLTNRLEQEAERIASETGRQYNDPAVRAEARSKLTTHEGATMPVVGRMKRPLRVGGKDETFLEMNDAYNPATEEFGEATGPLVDLMQGLRDASAKYNDVGDIQNTIDELFEIGLDGGVTASGALKVLRASDALLYATDDAGALASHEIIREAFQRAGFDGVIDRTVSQRFKNMKGMDENTAHYVFFDPSNIRGKFAAFDPAQSSSSKLLAGMADNATGYGTGIGAIAGGTFARDTDGDGVVSASERAAGALGGAITGGIGGAAFGAGVRRMGKAPPVGNRLRTGANGFVGGGIRYGKDPTRTENVFRDVGGKPFNNDPAAVKKLNRLFDNGNYIDAKLPTHRLYATQETVNPGFAENTTNRYVEGAGGVEAPAVVKYKGNYYVTDGHHRVTKAVMDGKSNVRVRLYDIDGDTSLDTPLLDFNPERHAKDRARERTEINKLLDELFADAEPVAPTKPPPAQAGFGGGNGTKAPPKPKGEGPGIVSRMVTGGVVGGIAGSAGTADPQEALGVNEFLAPLAEERKRISGLEKELDIILNGTVEEKQAYLAQSRGLKISASGEPDGKLGPDTRAAIVKARTELEAAIKEAQAREKDIGGKAEKRRAEIEMKAAFDRTKPNGFVELARELGPWLGIGAGAVTGALMRRGAVQKTAKASAAKAASLNRLVSDATPTTSDIMVGRKAMGKRATNLNEFWYQGGANKPDNLKQRLGLEPKQGVAFKPDGNGDWMGNPNAKDAFDLFKPGTKHFKMMDMAVIGAAMAESEFAGNLAKGFHQEAVEAQAAVDKAQEEGNAANLEIAMARLESAKNAEAAAIAFQRFGQVAALARTAGAFKMPYEYTRPNVKKAQADQALILDAINRSRNIP